MIKLTNIIKIYNKNKDNQINALNDLSIDFKDTGLVTILGRSGCGKTTLLNIIGGLDSADRGSVTIDDVTIDKYNSKKWDDLRNKKIGYIFQNYYLINNKTVFENLEIALNLSGLFDKEEIKKKIDYSLKLVGLEKFKSRLPSSLSGGQQQRVGIARAIIKSPKLLLADEPTGNLDSKNTLEIMKILKEISKTCLVILITHEEKLANVFSDRIIKLRDGYIIEDNDNICNEENGDYNNKIFIDKEILKPILNKEKGSAIKTSIAFKNVLHKYFDEPLINKKLKSHVLLFISAVMLVFSIAFAYRGLVFDKSSYKRDTRILEIQLSEGHSVNDIQQLIGQFGIESIKPIGSIIYDYDNFFNSSYYSYGNNNYDFFSQTDLKNPSLIYGNKAIPESGEVVIDYNLAVSMMDDLKSKGITRMDFLIGETAIASIYNRYKIVGIVKSEESKYGIYMNNDDYNDFYTGIIYFSTIYIISNDKKATKKALYEICTEIRDPYQEAINEYKEDRLIYSGFGTLFSLLILLFVIDINRRKIKAEFIEKIKEIGTLRCIGAYKTDISKENIFESLIVSTFSSFLGFIIGSYCVLSISKALFMDNIFYYPWWLMILLGIFLYGVNVFFTLFTMNGLLKKTPAEIMAKYDI